jgi:hypothetical protein
MSRLSIAARSFACAALFLAASAAEAAVAVRSIDDLRADPTVAALEAKFITLVAGAMLYASCEEEYSLGEEQIAYQKAALARVTKEYGDSFFTAYVAKVSAPPPQNIVDYYAKYIVDAQQAVVADVDSKIQRGGCKQVSLEKHYREIEKMRIAEEAAALKAKAGKVNPWAQPTQ